MLIQGNLEKKVNIIVMTLDESAMGKRICCALITDVTQLLCCNPAPYDYVQTVSQISFNAAKHRRCAHIPIVDDGSFELPESFNVVIETLDQNVTINPDKSTVTIVDNDCKCPILLSRNPANPVIFLSCHHWI